MHSPEFDPLLVVFAENEAIDEAGWEVDVFWHQASYRHNLFDFNDASLSCSGNVWVEIASTLSEHHIA